MLFHEYALDPRLLNNWQDFRFFYEAFGWNTGRLICRYPRRWKRMVFDSLGECTALEQQRIVERMARMEEKMVIRQREWDGGEADWLVNAENEHLREPFYRVVAIENPRENPDVLIGEDVDNDDDAWRLKPEIDVERQAGELAEAIRLLLRSARTVYLIDPHFGPENNRHVRPLRAFVEACVRERREPLEAFEYHTASPSTPEFFREECTRKIKGWLPAGFRIRFVRWQSRPGSEGLHDRFVLTELGGVRFSVGLDYGPANSHTGVSILSKESLRKCFDDYLSETPAFDFVDDLILEGENP